MPDLAKKIGNLRRRLGLTQTAFATLNGVDQSTVARWEAGAEPERDNLRKLAALDGKTLDEFFSDAAAASPHSEEDVQVIGHVQAGEWREAMEWPESDRYSLRLPRDKRYVGLSRMGLVVRGTSMNQVFVEGSILVCLNMFEVNRSPFIGEYVIVRRRQRDGHIEATVKQLQLDADGVPWLWPRSADPLYQQPLRLPEPAEGDDNEDVLMTGVVIASYRLEGPSGSN